MDPSQPSAVVCRVRTRSSVGTTVSAPLEDFDFPDFGQVKAQLSSLCVQLKGPSRAVRQDAELLLRELREVPGTKIDGFAATMHADGAVSWVLLAVGAAGSIVQVVEFLWRHVANRERTEPARLTITVHKSTELISPDGTIHLDKLETSVAVNADDLAALGEAAFIHQVQGLIDTGETLSSLRVE